METKKNTPSISSVRRRLVLSVLALGAAVLLWRAVDLQLTHKAFLQTQGDARHLRVVTSPAHRGMILDRNGEPLAVSTPVDSVWVNPQAFGIDPGAREDQRWRTLARLLDRDPAQIERFLAERADRQFVYLKRHVAPDVAEEIRRLELSGVGLEREYRRYYPTGEVAAHVVGFTDVDDRGQEGIELGFDDWLEGVDGAKRVIRDRLGRNPAIGRLGLARPAGVG